MISGSSTEVLAIIALVLFQIFVLVIPYIAKQIGRSIGKQDS